MSRSSCRRPLPPSPCACALLALASAFAAPAIAGGPPNDAWVQREAIATLPYTDIEGGISSATLAAGDPVFPCMRTSPPTTGARTLWYSYTTGDDVEYVNVSASGFDAELAIWRGDPTDGFVLETGACNDDGGGGSGSASLVGIRLQPNTEYSIEVATYDASVPATLLQLTVDRARTYNVTKTADTNDGTCDADCSLREAVRAANQNGGAVIVPAGTYGITIAGTEDGNVSGDLDVVGPIGIYGAGPDVATGTIVDGNDIDRVLHLDPANTGKFSFAIADLAITDGSAPNGGGIANLGGGVNPDFVGLANVRLFLNETSGQGGGARLDGASRIEDSTIANNLAVLDGGGLAAVGTGPTRLVLLRSTVSNNTSQHLPTGGGGGVFVSGGFPEIETSTLSANAARVGGGGVLASGAAALAVRNATLVGNRADAQGGSGGTGGGLRHEGTASVTVANSVLAGNLKGTGSTASDCALLAGSALVAQDDLVQAPENCTLGGSNNVTGVAAGLGPLADNGGATLTYAPLPGSPVIDTGAASCGGSDQRGAKRPSDGDANGTATCDRGAVESGDALVFRNGFE
ncbi:MAG TPA: CSLREA domain-containing protein [Xanthomonadales bacterium]|nr:CSLREA domain-containing protein [Xanthomonadales bacterium]